MHKPASPEFSAVHAEILSTSIANAGSERELERAMALHGANLLGPDKARMNKEYLARLAQIKGFK